MSLFPVQTQELPLHKGFKMKINEATVCAYYGFNATNTLKNLKEMNPVHHLLKCGRFCNFLNLDLVFKKNISCLIRYQI